MKISDSDQTGDYKTTVEIDMDSYDPTIEIAINDSGGGTHIYMNYADFCNIRDFIEGFERKIARIKAVK